MVASEFSLVAFLLLLVMVFSKKWVYPSKSRFHQRYPKNITNRLYTSIHTMSTGLMYTCISRSCSVSDSGKGESLHPGPGPACLDLSGGPHGLVPSYQPSSFGLQDGFAGMVISRDHVLSLVNSPDPVEDVISLGKAQSCLCRILRDVWIISARHHLSPARCCVPGFRTVSPEMTP